MAQNKLLIVGGSGFIGSHLVQEGLRQGYDVTVASIAWSEEFKSSCAGRIHNLTVDATKKDELQRALGSHKYNFVINCSGFIDHRSYSKGGRDLIDQHLIAVMNIIDALDQTELRSFVQVGSSDEYGNSQAPQSETYREASISPYSFGKAAATHLLQMLHLTEKFPARIVRLFLVYGPGQDDKRFLPQIIKGCLDGKTFPVSAGEQLRDFCYVEDVVRGIFMAMEDERAAGEVLNIASGEPVTIRSVIEQVQTTIGQGQPEFGKIPYRQGENMGLYASIDKARKVIGWSPTTSFAEGIARTIDYYKGKRV